MELARVIGNVVATVKYPTLEGVRMLVIQPLDENLADVAEPLVACDPLQSGPGDIVSWVTGREAALALPQTFAPVDASIVQIVDHARGDRDKYIPKEPA